MKIAKIILLFLPFVFFQCKSDSTSTANSAKADYQNAPSKDSADKFLSQLALDIYNEQDPAKKESMYAEGIQIAKKEGLMNRVLGFLVPLVKNYPNSSSYADNLFDLGQFMHSIKKFETSDIIFSSLQSRFSNHPKIDEATSKMTSPIGNIDTFMNVLSNNIFKDPNKFGINERNARAFVDGAEAFALANPSSANAPVYLFKAAEVAKSVRSFTKSMNLYDWILQKYPNYEKAPTSLFLKGFLIENELGQISEARKIYEQFLKQYPKHDLADDVEFLIENLGKSDEEILQMIEEKRKNK